MFVLMLNGHPISAKLPEDLGFGERFWYWRGRSGQSYIHSIYSRETCPPLPGAVFILVRRDYGSRVPVRVGRFPFSIEGSRLDIAKLVPGLEVGDEIHVHLLARDSNSAEHVLCDLGRALQDDSVPGVGVPGFAEITQSMLVAA
jgi:hypothetical protein